MHDTMVGPPGYHGSLVAFEGPPDTISTQLRLLPSSPRILIIPPLQHFMNSEAADRPFEAHSHILRIHQACHARAETARSFLHDSSPNNKRLAFMHGGSASAQMDSIAAISEHVTSGDVTKAEAIFHDLVQHGVAGLKRQGSVGPDSKSAHSNHICRERNNEDDEIHEYSAWEAMKAADALDLKTASLQPNTELDLTVGGRLRSTSVPVQSLTDDPEDVAPFYVFGASGGARRPILLNRKVTNSDPLPLDHDRHGRAAPRVERWRARMASRDQLRDQNAIPRSPSCIGEAYPKPALSSSQLSIRSPMSAGFGSIPGTPVSIGEALVVDVRSSSPVKNPPRAQDISLRNYSLSAEPRLRSVDRSGSTIEKRSSASSETLITCTKGYGKTPRATLARPSKTMIRRDPPPPLDLQVKIPKRPASYVDQGTSPIHVYVHQSTSTESNYLGRGCNGKNQGAFLDLEEDVDLDVDVPFRTALPMVEDLVIHFKGEEANQRLEAAIRAFETGTYPVSMPPVLTESNGNPERQSNPSSIEPTAVAGNKISAGQEDRCEPTPTYHSDPNEYDPFASHGDYLQPPTAFSAKPALRASRPVASGPPTPAQTPPPRETRSGKSFHELKTTDCKTAVCVQNKLRSVLNIYFSPEDIGYYHLNFPLLPGLSSLWKPVFRESEVNGLGNEKRKIDLILAIGAQKGVDREFLGALSGSLEKLGTKPNGITRSGRLDLRYLIANAMQAFTAQPLASQTQDNPFSNPLLLATLIIPYLEMYVAAHNGTRFLLLEFPPEHLTTVLALQRLVGLDLLKVAGILDSEAKEPKACRESKPQSQTSTHSAAKPMSGLSANSPRTGMKSPEPPSFSKANFLLTSSATESEIATLISAIWKILIDTSSFYIPEGAAPRSAMAIDGNSTRKYNRGSRDRPLTQTPLIDTKQRYSTNAPLASATAMLGFESAAFAPCPPSNYVSSGTDAADASSIPAFPAPPAGASTRRYSLAPSVSGTIKSSRTVKTMHSQRNKLRYKLGREIDGSSNNTDATYTATNQTTPAGQRPGSGRSVSYFDISEEEDDDEDGTSFAADERRYMPLWREQHQQPNAPFRKGNSRKALKWLGLAT
ncbi:Uu.00g067210.m01.CDS01 [Anthostomella pinea]|uniref:Uu.00g067210.m01.CDS01 n=1 Tax=Anthostomella pinea TaxID=933095 RepID=A0AAI8VNH9_9PEZI|nr:Uu.00g067210.m01.CDS01 [Anthostomella pinea]